MVPTTVLIICGLIGIIVVLVFAIASGVGNGTFDRLTQKNKCPADASGITKPVPYKTVATKASYTLSSLLPAGSCPVSYTSFTNLDGASLCCASSNIDIYARTCAATGAESICAMSPGILDTRNLDESTHYPECKAIAKRQTQALSGKLCPMAYPNYATMSGSGYKCCSGPLAAGGTDCLSGISCSGLANGQNVFNTPSSCEKSLMLEQTQCPAGTNMVPDMKGSSTKTRDLMIPLCVGVKGNCLPRTVLLKLRQAGYFTDINIEKNILNCDVYDKVYNDRLLSANEVDTAKSVDM